MQDTLAFHNLLRYAEQSQQQVDLYVRPKGLRIPDGQGITTDDGRYIVTGYRLEKGKRQLSDIHIGGWVDAFWNVMEQMGWMVANKRRVSNGESLWTLVPMEQPDEVVGVPTVEELAVYVEKVRPMAGIRAQRALELAISGKVYQLTPDANNKDRWQVEGTTDNYIVSITGGYCTCPDAANGAPRWMDAPLCKHRLAAMYIYRWLEEKKKQQMVPSNPQTSVKGSHHTPPATYVTVAPPVTAKEGWRWVHVREGGRLNLHSSEEYRSVDEAIAVARTIADAKHVPLYLNGYAKKEG